MSKLVDEPKLDHAQLTRVLDEVDRLGVHTKEGLAKLTSARSAPARPPEEGGRPALPALRNAARTKADLQATIDTFAKDMEVVSKEAIAFFDKYATGGSGLDFARLRTPAQHARRPDPPRRERPVPRVRGPGEMTAPAGRHRARLSRP